MSPLAGAAVYDAVLAAADGRCQCHTGKPGACGSRHRADGENGPRCHERGHQAAPLLAVPLDPATPERVAVTLGPEKLLALCSGCDARRRNRARKAREAQLARQLAEMQGGLFDLPDDTERTAS